MAESKPQQPEVGDLVIATIEPVTNYGTYTKQGLLHTSKTSLF